MKILHLLKTSLGAAWALRQMRELVRLGVEVHVALPGGGPLIDKCQESGIHTHVDQFDFPVGRPWRLAPKIRSLRRLVKEIAPDLIHSHFVGTTLTMRTALRGYSGVPRVFQVPGPLHLEYPFFSHAEMALADRRDYWIASCRWTRNRYLELGIPRDRVFLSYYGVDLNQFTTGNRGTLRAELGLASDTKMVGMVAFMYAPKRYLGQTRGLKGHEDLIDAIRICLDRGVRLTGIFVGGPWNNCIEYEGKLRRYAELKCGDYVRFLGTRSDIANLYSGMDLAVHPSHSENVGGALESLLMGVPTIAANVGGIPDLVSHGETGWLVPAKNPPKLAATIGYALEHLEAGKEMALVGRERAMKLFDAERTSKEIYDIYTRILKYS
ncbi:MAG: glycosyltransferase family 4 protein [Deltaproteobacteria bacterium]|nr:glycosyltransferase family 4 protein [Deltaproteobacteria bacterium]